MAVLFGRAPERDARKSAAHTLAWAANDSAEPAQWNYFTLNPVVNGP